MRFRIGSGCGEDWSAMAPVAGGRHCGRCDRDVVDLTRLTRRQAGDEVRARGGKLCIRLAVDARGEPIFREEPRRLGPARAIALAGALLGCEAAEEPRPIAATAEVPVDAAPLMLPLAPVAAPPPSLTGLLTPAPAPDRSLALEPAPTPELEPAGPTPAQRALTRRKRRQLAAATTAPPPASTHIWMGAYVD